MSFLSSHTLAQLFELDPIFQGIAQRYGPAPDWQRPPGFASLLHIILEQQVSLESAQAAYNKLEEQIGHPSPEALLGLSDETLRACYFSRQKSRYSKALAQAILDDQLQLDTLHLLEEAQIREQLEANTGIGQWTSDIYLIFCLGHPDIFPIGDIAAVNAVRELCGVKEKEAVWEKSLQWQPMRRAATKMLWHDYLCKRGRNQYKLQKENAQ